MPDTNYFTGIDVVDAVRIDPLTVEQDGVYTAPTGTLGYNPVTVNVSSTIDYSTTEQDTGIKWVDGKSIYQITFIPNTYYTSENININLASLNIDKILRISAFGSDNDPYASNNKWTIDSIGGDNSRYIYVDTNWDVKLGSNKPLYAITIQYTKSGS